jgi:peptidoglycan-associated lipoprotein
MTALLFGGTAAAQQPGTLLLGGFGQYTKFDDALQLDDVFGVGGRVGAYFAPNWNLEYEHSYNRPEQQGAGQSGKIWYGPVSARIRYSFPFGGFGSFHIGAGGVLSSYAGYEPSEPTGQELIDIRSNSRSYNYGVQGNIGFSFGLGGVSLRVDGLADYMPEGGRIGGTSGDIYEGHTNLRAQAGLEVRPNLASLFGGSTYSESVAPWAPYSFWDDLGSDWALPGMIELGAFAQYTHFDENAPGPPEDDGIGFGGRVGVFLSDVHWQLEADGQLTPGLDWDQQAFAGDLDFQTWAVRMNYNIPIMAKSQFILGLGGVRSNYSADTEDTNRSFTYNYGVSGLAGLRFGITNRVALRVDGLVEYMPDTENLNLAARGGLSLLVGGARREAMCTYAGLENIPASSPSCVPPAPPPAPPAPAMCPYPGLGGITAADPACVAPPAAVVVDTAAITAPIYFDFDKSDIRTDAAATLDRKIPWLQANPGMRIRIEGNADERGSDEYNLALGQRRAAAAKRYLVERGIDEGRFDLVSYGEERPVCTEHDESCWQRNRRDDFVIVTIGSDMIVVPPGGEE